MNSKGISESENVLQIIKKPEVPAGWRGSEIDIILELYAQTHPQCEEAANLRTHHLNYLPNCPTPTLP